MGRKGGSNPSPFGLDWHAPQHSYQLSYTKLHLERCARALRWVLGRICSPSLSRQISRQSHQWRTITLMFPARFGCTPIIANIGREVMIVVDNSDYGNSTVRWCGYFLYIGIYHHCFCVKMDGWRGISGRRATLSFTVGKSGKIDTINQSINFVQNQ